MCKQCYFLKNGCYITIVHGKQIILMMMIIIIIIIIIITVMQREHLQDAIALTESLRDVFVAKGLRKVEILNRRSCISNLTLH